MAFPWLSGSRAAGPAYTPRTSKTDMYRRELLERAALLRRLGYPRERALARLRANVAWDFELGAGTRPTGLADAAIATIVETAYTRR